MASVHHHQKLLTVKEFFRFWNSQPGDERWELYDGVAVMSPSASDYHQAIVGNLIFFLDRAAQEIGADWICLPGLSVVIPGLPPNVPMPDVIVLPGPLTGDYKCDNPIVVVEILSPGSKKRDLEIKRGLYTRLASLAHYVVIAQDKVSVTMFARTNGWRPERTEGIDAELALPALGVTVPLRQIYRRTKLDPRGT